MREPGRYRALADDHLHEVLRAVLLLHCHFAEQFPSSHAGPVEFGAPVRHERVDGHVGPGGYEPGRTIGRAGDHAQLLEAIYCREQFRRAAVQRRREIICSASGSPQKGAIDALIGWIKTDGFEHGCLTYFGHD